MSDIENWFEEEKEEQEYLKDVVEKEKQIFHCKVCAEPFPISQKALCSYCNAPMCPDCDSVSFCLNCYINLHDSVQVQLKLTKTLAWAVPILLGAIGVITQFNLAFWIFGVGGMFGFFAGAHYFVRYLILGHPEKYISPHWRKIVDALEYKAFIQEDRPLKVNTFFAITPDAPPLIEKANAREKAKQTTPHPYSPETLEKLSPPAYLDKDFGLKFAKENLEDEDSFETEAQKRSSLEEVKRELSRLRGESCPFCENELELGGVCFTCNLKICPECFAGVNLVSTKCVCGYRFTPLQALFKTPARGQEKKNAESKVVPLHDENVKEHKENSQ